MPRPFGPHPAPAFAPLFVTDEAGNFLVTEAGDFILTEGWGAAPVTIPTTYLKRVSKTVTVGALDSFGRPVAPTSTDVVEDWGRLQVQFALTDVTFLRGAPCEVVSWSSAEPFGDETAVIRFPQISPYDTLGTGDLAPFAAAQQVIIRRVYTDTSGVERTVELWRGLWVSEDVEHDESSGGTTFHDVGILYEADQRVAKPTLNPAQLVDVSESLYEALSGQDHSGDRFHPFRFLPPDPRPPLFGVTTPNMANWQPLLTGYVQDLLALAYDPTTGAQWSVTNDGPRAVVYKKNTTTVDWTVTVGTPGLTVKVARDLSMQPNAIYASGLSPSDGCEWRNSKYPGLPSADPAASYNGYVAPLVIDTTVEPYTYDSTGFVTGSNPGYDRNALRVERYEAFGRNEKAEGVQSAQQELTRGAGIHYAGTVSLRIDPQEGSRFDIRAGDNLLLKALRGADRVFHIARVVVNFEKGQVDLTVDTQARDRITLAAILERRRDNLDLVRRPRPTRNASQIVSDKISNWDCESGAGVIPATSVPMLGWAVRQIPVATRGTIKAINVQATSAVEMAVGVFDRPITPAELVSKGSPPDDGYWDFVNWSDTSGLVQAVGAGTDLGGYYPKAASDPSAPITGRIFLAQDSPFECSQPPWLWVCMWSTGATSMSGRLYPGPQL